MDKLARGALLGAAVVVAACTGTPAAQTPTGGGGGQAADLQDLDGPATPAPRPTAHATPTLTPTLSPTAVPTATPTTDGSASDAASPTPEPTATPDESASGTAQASPSPSPSPSPTATPTPTPKPSFTPTPEPTPTLECPAATPAPGGGTTCFPPGTAFSTKTVNVKLGGGGTFTPAHVYIRPGVTTTWTNSDILPHSVTGVDLGAFNSGTIAAGASYSHTWTHPGTWTAHDGMARSTPPTFNATVVPN